MSSYLSASGPNILKLKVIRIPIWKRVYLTGQVSNFEKRGFH